VVVDLRGVVGSSALREAGALLKQGQLVAFPTETVYGLGASALLDESVLEVFRVKGRPPDNPLIVHVCSKEQMMGFVSHVPALAHKLMDVFWPGPLTLLLPKAPEAPLSRFVTAGLPHVGVRMPAHPVALALIEAAGVPIAAPSANVSGRPSPTRAEHVLRDFDGRIPMVVDGGAVEVGVESTVVEVVGDSVVICRPGGVSFRDLEAVVGCDRVTFDAAVKVDTASKAESSVSAPKAPGMKYLHYAPKAPLILVEGSLELLKCQVDQALSKGACVGVLAFDEILNKLEQAGIYKESLGCEDSAKMAAARLYAALRNFDETPVNEILCFLPVNPRQNDIIQTVINRLLKASKKIIRDDEELKD